MLYTLCVFLLVAILYTLMVLLNAKRKQFTSKEDIIALDLSPEELYKVLNFLLMYGVIDFKEYTNMELKSLPYVKR
jgi:ACR3 family arsenite efflux pump ArsB